MKTIILGLLLSAAAWAQCGALTVNPLTGRFDCAGKSSTTGGVVVGQKFFGTSAPGSVSGNLPGDIYVDTTAHLVYVCGAASGTAAPACTSVAVAGWLLVNGLRAYIFDNDTQSATAIQANQISGRALIGQASTIVEIDILAGTQLINGTPTLATFTGSGSVQVGATGTASMMSGFLTASAGKACMLASAGSATCPMLGQAQVATYYISTTALAAGSILQISGYVADGVETFATVIVWVQVN